MRTTSNNRTGWARDSHKGTWVPVYSSVPSAPDKPIPPPAGPTEDNAQQTAAELKFKEREFILRGTAVPTFANPRLTSGGLVSLRGLGTNFSGDYKIDMVKHTIRKDAGYSMAMELSRNAFGANAQGNTSPASQTGLPRTAREEATPKTPEVRYHTIRQGDTLWGLAERYYGNGNLHTRITQANHGINPNNLRIGSQIIIP